MGVRASRQTWLWFDKVLWIERFHQCRGSLFDCISSKGLSAFILKSQKKKFLCVSETADCIMWASSFAGWKCSVVSGVRRSLVLDVWERERYIRVFWRKLVVVVWLRIRPSSRQTDRLEQELWQSSWRQNLQLGCTVTLFKIQRNWHPSNDVTFSDVHRKTPINQIRKHGKMTHWE